MSTGVAILKTRNLLHLIGGFREEEPAYVGGRLARYWVRDFGSDFVPIVSERSFQGRVLRNRELKSGGPKKEREYKVWIRPLTPSGGYEFSCSCVCEGVCHHVERLAFEALRYDLLPRTALMGASPSDRREGERLFDVIEGIKLGWNRGKEV